MVRWWSTGTRTHTGVRRVSRSATGAARSQSSASLSGSAIISPPNGGNARQGGRMRITVAGVVGAIVCLGSAFAVWAAEASAAALAKFKDASLPADARVKALISQMTLEEKAGQVGHTAPAIPRLGIPEYNWWNEGLHGVARAGVATVFPQAIGMAASWDAPLMHQVADVISTEFRAKYVEKVRPNGGTDWYRGLTVWSPNINIFRDPRWGRGQETYGEDPYLTSRIGVAFITGLQGNDAKYLKTVATSKHFAVH